MAIVSEWRHVIEIKTIVAIAIFYPIPKAEWLLLQKKSIKKGSK